MRCLAGWLMLLMGATLDQTDLQLTPQSLTVHPNLVRNGSFEQVQNGLPLGWSWDKRNTDATVQVVEGESATGARCLKLTSTTPFAPHTYGLLRYEGGVPVKPDTVYTLSIRYKAKGGYQGFVGGGKNWRVRLPFEDTGGQWKRAAITFATASDETNFELIIVIEAPSEGLYLDDLKLEEGREATFFVPAETPDRPLLYLGELPSQVYLNEASWRSAIEFYMPTQANEALVEIQLGEQRVYRRANLPAGVVRAEFQFAEPPAREQTLRVRIEAPPLPVVEASRTLAFFTRREAQQRLEAIRQSLPRWQSQLDTVRQRGQDIAYPLASFTILQEFVPYVASDLQKGLLQRAFQQLEEMESIAQRLTATLEAVLNGKRRLPTVPRYVTSPVEIKGSSLIADTVDPLTGKRARRPVFFVGFGHFRKVREDLEKFPRMGFNLIQIEMGVSDILPRKGEVSLQKLETDILPVLRRAAQANVRVDLLISPHYMPDWVLQEYPELRQRREGFLQYSLFAPQSLQVLKEYIRQFAPRLRNQPALNSICLSNEPMNVEDPQSAPQLRAWREWLKARHKTLLTLNARWKTNYQQWDEIPIPTEGAPYAEFCLFNQEWTANWHRALAQEVKRYLPGVPVHSKLMSWVFLNDTEQHRGIDPQLFAEFCDLHGNDALTFYNHAPNSLFAFGWVGTMMAHDLQRSLRNAPLFNSENHVIPDREERPVPPQHGRAVLWEEAIRGLSATTFWVWERTDDPQSDFAGSVLHRPAFIEALAHTALDLNRLAPYVAALQNQPPDVYLYHSPLDLVLQGADALIARDSLYIALTMLGVRVGFVTERQAAARQLPAGNKRILLPNVQYLSDEALIALDAYRQQGGGLVALGEPILRFDQYGRPRSSRLPIQIIDRDPGLDARLVHQRLARLLDEWNIARPLRLLDEQDQPAWGVAYRTAPYQNGFVASLCNYTQKPITVRLRNDKGQPIRAVNLFTGERVSGQLTLQPLEPVLLQW
ncbi:MAG: beta-galactosidase [Armatimonadota bacterium]